LSGPIVHALGPRPYVRLFRRNYIGVPATVLYDREKLVACSGFDPDLRSCEDFDLYLRMARHYPVAHYPDLVARYRLHGGNMSNDVAQMLKWHLFVLEKNRPSGEDEGRDLEKWHLGVRYAKADYAMRAWTERSPPLAIRWRNRRYMLRMAPLDSCKAIVKAAALRILPEWAKRRIKAAIAKVDVPEAEAAATEAPRG
jgi:hypothetical protein